tara:strand:- start:675 stop:1022 length:348 start_codon:yes stop_codon:yes gene_type:complete
MNRELGHQQRQRSNSSTANPTSPFSSPKQTMNIPFELSSEAAAMNSMRERERLDRDNGNPISHTNSHTNSQDTSSLYNAAADRRRAEEEEVSASYKTKLKLIKLKTNPSLTRHSS